MTVLNCRGCGLPLARDDLFCGNCGTKAPGGIPPDSQLSFGHPPQPWPDAGTRPGPYDDRGWHVPAGGPAQPNGFFYHAAARPKDRMSNPTRYLCAAAYLNPWYANWVTGELLASHRAVAPSVDADVEPIIRHCLHARKIALIRDLVLTVVLIAGLIVATSATITVLILALAMAFMQGPVWQRRSAGAKVAIGAGVLAALFGVVILVAVGTLISHLGQVFSSVGTGVPFGSSAGTATGFFLLKVLICWRWPPPR
jgi:hypothetical protein